MNKKIILIAIVVIGLAVFGAYEYLTRPPLAPTVNVSDVADKSVSDNKDMADQKVYKIDQSKSKVEFGINEVLRGSQFVARGTTNQIGGDILLSSEGLNFSEISINARTFKTDDSKRDGAINRMILKTSDPKNELITFLPDSVSGAPYKITGNEFDLDVKGLLTISQVSKEIIFPLHINIDQDSVTGSGQLRIKRSDFDLKIPNLSFIASVDDEFPIYADFVATLVK